MEEWRTSTAYIKGIAWGCVLASAVWALALLILF